MPKTLSLRVPAVTGGRVSALGPGGRTSAIAKAPLPGPWRIGPLGIEGDEQADLRVHGGPDRAVHLYPAAHYAAWRAEIGDHPLLRTAGGFGENLSPDGAAEGDVCVGDVFAFGGARLQVTVGRQPCWKLNVRFGRPDMSRRLQETGRIGWLHRVLEPGVAEPGATLDLVDRPRPEWTMARLVRLLYVDRLDRDGLAGMAAIPELGESWRRIALRRLETGAVEDHRPRLEGDAAG